MMEITKLTDPYPAEFQRSIEFNPFTSLSDPDAIGREQAGGHAMTM
jgi:hypothetical protein